MVNEHIWGLPADQSTQLSERSIPVVCSVCKTTSAHQLMLFSEWLMLRQKFLYKDVLNTSQNVLIGWCSWIQFRNCWACHPCCHCLYLMRPYRRKVWFWWVLIGEANSFGHLATEMSAQTVSVVDLHQPALENGQCIALGSLQNKAVSQGFCWISGRYQEIPKALEWCPGEHS